MSMSGLHQCLNVATCYHHSKLPQLQQMVDMVVDDYIIKKKELVSKLNSLQMHHLYHQFSGNPWPKEVCCFEHVGGQIWRQL